MRRCCAAETLPPWCYTSQEWFDLEVEHIFMKYWNFIGRVDRVPNPGDFVTLTYTGAPVIIVRGRDNVTGLPRQLHLTSQEVREAMADNVNQIIEAVKVALEATPPELAADIADKNSICSWNPDMYGVDMSKPGAQAY